MTNNNNNHHYQYHSPCSSLYIYRHKKRFSPQCALPSGQFHELPHRYGPVYCTAPCLAALALQQSNKAKQSPLLRSSNQNTNTVHSIICCLSDSLLLYVHKTIRFIRDRGPRTAILTFTQLLSTEICCFIICIVIHANITFKVWYLCILKQYEQLSCPTF